MTYGNGIPKHITYKGLDQFKLVGVRKDGFVNTHTLRSELEVVKVLRPSWSDEKVANMENQLKIHIENLPENTTEFGLGEISGFTWKLHLIRKLNPADDTEIPLFMGIVDKRSDAEVYDDCDKARAERESRIREV